MYAAAPTVNAGSRICQPITQANCRRDRNIGSKSILCGSNGLTASASKANLGAHPRRRPSDVPFAISSPRPVDGRRLEIQIFAVVDQLDHLSPLVAVRSEIAPGRWPATEFRAR